MIQTRVLGQENGTQRQQGGDITTRTLDDRPRDNVSKSEPDIRSKTHPQHQGGISFNNELNIDVGLGRKMFCINTSKRKSTKIE